MKNGGTQKSAAQRRTRAGVWLFLGLAAWSALAVWVSFRHGWQYYFGDAEAHLDIARRIFDNYTPAYDQVGTVWLPLPHWLMLPLVHVDKLWQNGMAGAIPSAVGFVLGAWLLYAATRRVFDSTAAGLAAAALVALNPNLLYLQTTAMTEAILLACLMGLLYGSVCFAERQNLWGAAGAGIAALAATLTRYEGWFLIPFVTAYFLIVGKQRRWWAAAIFGAIASLGPLFWFAHNWWLNGDPLGFYSGPYSALAIQGARPYPGLHDWVASWRQYRTAAQICAGPVLSLMALAGAIAVLARRRVWPLVLLILPGIFYICSLHSGGTPIFVPTLSPFSWYNTRYGLGALPLLAVCAAGLVAVVPRRARAAVAVLVIAAATAPWLMHPKPRNWIVWQEARMSSLSRLAGTEEAVDFLGPRYRPGSGIVTAFGWPTGVYRRLGIHLSDTLTGDSDVFWYATMRRPDLWLHQDWIVLQVGDPMWKALQPILQDGKHYTLVKNIRMRNAPAMQIFRR